jgi:hypothetical protein
VDLTSGNVLRIDDRGDADGGLYFTEPDGSSTLDRDVSRTGSSTSRKRHRA